jgi:hypothetical protein
MQHLEDRYYYRLPAGKTVQGDIWTALPGAPHAAEQLTGIVITPRCDLAHDKARVFNYLPIVSLDTLVAIIGAFEILEQEERHTRQALRQVATQLGVEALYDIGTDATDIYEMVRQQAAAIDNLKQRDRLETTYSTFAEKRMKLERIRSALTHAALSLPAFDDLISASALQNYRRDVIRNSKADLFFLPPCASLLPYPSVVLLRYVVACSRQFLSCAVSSMTAADWTRVRAQNPSFEFKTAVQQPERILRLRTPYMESLMAKFCALFGRVGTRDLTPEEVAEFSRSEGD